MKDPKHVEKNDIGKLPGYVEAGKDAKLDKPVAPKDIEYEVDKDGKPVLDKDGKPVPVYEVDKDGKQILDKDGKPVPKAKAIADTRSVSLMIGDVVHYYTRVTSQQYHPEPRNEGPYASIVTGVNEDSVDLVVFPSGDDHTPAYKVFGVHDELVKEESWWAPKAALPPV